MRRLALTAAALTAVVAFVILATGAGSSSDKGVYWVELDNAFGLISGGDMKVAGVRAGKISEIKVDQTNDHALIGFKISVNGFGSLRTDVHCSSRPQSLIGEYYLDCNPGVSPQLLTNNSQSHPIPVSQTDSTISADLLQNVMREPYRQRFSIILGELGAAVGGNGKNLNDTIRRAVPALREVDNLLAVLAEQNQTLADLATQGDIVLHDLANNRSDVQRFVVSARGAAADTAARKAALEDGFRRLPGFLEQLRPTMVALGRVADTNTPAFANLSASAGQLKMLFNNLGPFAKVSTPSFAALGRASVTGDQAVRASTSTVQQLNTFAKSTPELGQNLSIILQHLDNPAFGSDLDPRAVAQHPLNHSNTYTGLEAFLQYAYDQTMSTNIFNRNGHLLALQLLVEPNTCSPYADAARARAQPLCRSWLGPSQPGVTRPDPTTTVPPAAAPRRAQAATARSATARSATARSASTSAGSSAAGVSQSTSQQSNSSLLNYLLGP